MSCSMGRPMGLSNLSLALTMSLLVVAPLESRKTNEPLLVTLTVTLRTSGLRAAGGTHGVIVMTGIDDGEPPHPALRSTMAIKDARVRRARMKFSILAQRELGRVSTPPSLPSISAHCLPSAPILLFSCWVRAF